MTTDFIPAQHPRDLDGKFAAKGQSEFDGHLTDEMIASAAHEAEVAAWAEALVDTDTYHEAMDAEYFEGFAEETPWGHRIDPAVLNSIVSVVTEKHDYEVLFTHDESDGHHTISIPLPSGMNLTEQWEDYYLLDGSEGNDSSGMRQAAEAALILEKRYLAMRAFAEKHGLFETP